MRTLLRSFINNILVIFVISYFTPVLSTASNQAIVTLAIVISLIYYIAKPILTLLWLPINLLSLGLLSWVPLTVVLYTSILLVNGIDFHHLVLPELNIGSIHTPNIHFGFASSLIAFTFIYLFTKKLIRWVSK